VPSSFDPFARPAFYADAAVDELARGRADLAVELAERELKIRLGWSSDDVARLESVLAVLHGQHIRGELPEPVLRAHIDYLGSYYGELIRRLHGGRWGIGRLYTDTAPAVQLGSDEGISVFPIFKVRMRIEHGARADISMDYSELAQKLKIRKRGSRESARAAKVIRPRKVYQLRHDNGDFDAGVTKDGRQLLMSFFWSGITAIFFDSEGNLLGHEIRPLPMPPPTHPNGVQYQTKEFDAAVKLAIDQWKSELGFKAEPIRVRRFQSQELGLGIDDRPWHFEEFLKAPEALEPDEKERARTWEHIEDWERDGSFVLYWGNALWVNGAGVVTSS